MKCCTYFLLMSRDFVGLVQISLPATYLEILRLVGRFFILQRKGKSKRFPEEMFQISKCLSRYLRHLLQKDPIWLDFTGRRRLALLRIFIRRFSECVNIALPFLRPLFEPITFGFSIPDITVNIKCACAQLRPMTLTR